MLHDLAEQTYRVFMDDVRHAARAIETVTGSQRINVAVLGNTESHVHAHLVPRVAGGDPVPTRPHWEDPRPVRSLHTERAARLVSDLRAATGSMAAQGATSG